MVSGFYLPVAYAKQLNKLCSYDLFYPKGIGKAVSCGNIWYQKKKKKWATHCQFHTGYFEVRVQNIQVATVYMAKRVLLKLDWKYNYDYLLPSVAEE